MATMKKFNSPQQRPLPVFLLADVSGSMGADGKINALNQSVREMIATFAREENLPAAIQVCIITFGGEARLHTPLQPAARVTWRDMRADGGTPMGRAMEMAAELLENPGLVPSNAYCPTVVLVSDGQPTDNWRPGLERLTSQGRARKADRIALAIGADADEDMMVQFLNDVEKWVFHAQDARKIQQFFRYVSWNISSRSRSANPNVIMPMGEPFSLDNF
jgi:uncharacterized protein YegL